MAGAWLRGIRGATTVESDDAAEILQATEELLEAICERNGLRAGDVVSAIFTLTQDLRATFPAEAARRRGWTEVPMLCAQEIPVPGSLPRCVRVLLHVQTAAPDKPVHHVYLRRAKGLRPDWSGD